MDIKFGSCPTFWGWHDEHDCCLPPGHNDSHECWCGVEKE